MSEELMLAGITLAEKQQYYYNASHCIYCGEPTVYVDSIEVYQQSYGFVHLCRPCKSHVGCLINSDQSLGTVANKKLRDLRIETHKWYDPLIDMRYKVDGNRKTAQINGRKWLAEKLGIEVVECHIGYMTKSLCEKTIEICKATHEEIKRKSEERQIVTQERIGAFMFQCARLGLSYKDFDINGKVQYELTHTGKGQLLKYFPSKGEGQFDNGKLFTIENIETFIAENFKITEDAK